MEIFVCSFGRGHTVRWFLWSFWNLWCSCFKETLLSATAFTGNVPGDLPVPPELLRCARLPPPASVSFSSLSLNTHLQMCEKAWPHSFLQAALSSPLVQEMGGPAVSLFGLAQRHFSVCDLQSCRPQCCGVMTVITTRHVRRCKMTNVSIRANNAYRTLQGFPYAVTIEQRCWLIQGRVIAHIRASSILTALMGNALIFSSGPLKVTKHVVLRLNIY